MLLHLFYNKNTLNQKILIDSRLCRWRKPQAHNGYELDKLFNLELKEASIWQIYHISKRGFGVILYRLNKKWYEKYISYFYDHKEESYVEDYNNSSPFSLELITKQDSLYYDVVAQSYLYFRDYKKIISSKLQFNIQLDSLNQTLLLEIQKANAVSIHFRFGDYLELDNYNLCSLHYYNKAIDKVKSLIENPMFYLFCNDEHYLRKNYLPHLSLEEGSYTIISHNIKSNSYKDIILMNNCKGMILANSSFSWWGAWLNNVQNHLIIVPNLWTKNLSSDKVCPHDWIRI